MALSPKVIAWGATVAAAVCITAAGTAINTWADVRQMKDALASSVKAERIAKIEGQLEAHEEVARVQGQALNDRYADLVARVKSLEWQRNRDEDRRR